MAASRGMMMLDFSRHSSNGSPSHHRLLLSVLAWTLLAIIDLLCEGMTSSFGIAYFSLPPI
jgi:hypothetical protein